MFMFETCPWCSQAGRQEPIHMRPMVLSDDDSEMQCFACNRSFRLPDCDSIVDLARQQREKRDG